MKKKNEMLEKPNWYNSDYRGSWNWDKNEHEIRHTERVRCPFCGNEMTFFTPCFYEYRTSDWYWRCGECKLTLPNADDFSEEDLDRARKIYRRKLEEEMKDAREKYDRTKNLYNCYGRYFTPEEKRKRLIETIEDQTPKVELE